MSLGRTYYVECDALRCTLVAGGAPTSKGARRMATVRGWVRVKIGATRLDLPPLKPRTRGRSHVDLCRGHRP
jgi:hypothetical protein